MTCKDGACDLLTDVLELIESYSQSEAIKAAFIAVGPATDGHDNMPLTDNSDVCRGR